MGSGFSSLLPCFTKDHRSRLQTPSHFDQTSSLCEPLDEILGHSYCYIPYSNRLISLFSSNRFVSPSGSFRLSPSYESGQIQGSGSSEQLHTRFKAISGASISANTSNSKTVIQLDDIYDDAIKGSFGSCLRNSVVNVNGFEGTSSFSAFPLQPVPLGPDRVDLFMSGPIESLLGAVGGGEVSKRKKSLSWHLNFGERKQHPWVVRTDGGRGVAFEGDKEKASDMQWALGKAGEDRVQLAVFEKQGWLFAGIYDGFNGPDGPEFLMANLYRAVHTELRGLFWESEEEDGNLMNESRLLRCKAEAEVDALTSSRCPVTDNERGEILASSSEVVQVKERKRLRELLVEAQEEDALDLSDSDMFAGDNFVYVGSKRCLLMSKLKHGLSKQGMYVRKLFPWKFGVEKNEAEEVNNVGVEENVDKKRKRRKEGTIDHELVLRAMSNGLEATEQAFLEITEKVLNTNPELALMGSCLLVALIRDDDVYIMNIGDSRALVAQYQVEERPNEDSTEIDESHLQQTKLVALQLTTDHSTSIDDEVTRIKNEHPDDKNCIVNNRVKGRLKVTRAFGAGFLKQPKLNDALLEMFRNEYIGTDPYISCTPSLCHYRLTKNDQFMVISSDGLYQYLSNEEVVSLAMEKFPDGDPAQHVLHELLVRAAKKAGMSFHELLDIPQGDRRKYHDDCTVLVIALGGSRIWKSSGKYL